MSRYNGSLVAVWFIQSVSTVEAAQTGISLLHGNCAAFSNSGDPLLRSVYSYWKGVNLTGMNRTMVYKGLRKVVQDIIDRWVKNKNILTLPNQCLQATVFQDLCSSAGHG